MSGLVCYDVSSGSDESEGEDVELDVKPKLEPVEFTGVQVANQVLDEMLGVVTSGTRDFSDMYIKEEPMEPEEVKEEFDTDYRDSIKVELDSDDYNSDSSDSSESSVEVTVSKVSEESTKEAPPKTKNEWSLKDLPPVEELDMAVTEAEVVKIGTITGCVDELVVVESCPGNPAIDLESVLFLDSGRRPLGRVFDVIGPVSRPLYCVRFNSKDHIKEKEVVHGLDVYYAPKSEYTSFVFLDQLMKLKISDASWRDDEEPPPNFVDYSDDEEERMARQRRNNAKKAESAGTKTDEVQRKKARIDGSAGQRDASQRGRGGQNRNYNQQDGNARYDSQRHDNGLYDRTTNPFYRQARNYNPRDMGPIRWNNYNAPQNLQGPPPPPYSNRGGYSNQENHGYHTSHGPGYNQGSNQSGYNQGNPQYYQDPPQQNQPSHPGYYQDSYVRNQQNGSNQYNQQWQEPPPPLLSCFDCCYI